MPIHICGRCFQANVDAERHMAWIIGMYEDDTILDYRHKTFVYDYFQMFHPRWIEIGTGNGSNIDFIFVKTLPSTGRKVFCIRRKDGSGIALSFFLEHIQKGVDREEFGVIDFDSAGVPDINYKKILNTAMRQAVQYQSAQFKEDFFFRRPERVCFVTGEMITYETSQVHHHTEHTATLGSSFAEIANRFLEMKNIKTGTNYRALLANSEGVYYAVILDKEFVADWQEYHEKQCDLVVLSVQGHRMLHQQLSIANSRKAKKIHSLTVV
jgi:hypothetical protein